MCVDRIRTGDLRAEDRVVDVLTDAGDELETNDDFDILYDGCLSPRRAASMAAKPEAYLLGGNGNASAGRYGYDPDPTRHLPSSCSVFLLTISAFRFACYMLHMVDVSMSCPSLNGFSVSLEMTFRGRDNAVRPRSGSLW